MPIFNNLEPLSTCLVWKITRTLLPFIDRNNRLPKQFLFLFYKWKALAHDKSLLPSMKGHSFYFYVESSSSILMHQLREHSCHSEYNVHSPKIYSWLWYCLFSNYLYLVTLWTLKVSYAFMFCYSMKDKLNTTLLCFLYAQNKQITFNALLFMIFCLCCFSCCNMVTEFFC
jgi:hypothetical protein